VLKNSFKNAFYFVVLKIKKTCFYIAKISAVSRKLVHSRTPLYLTERTAG